MVKFRLHSVYNFSSVNIYNYSGIAMGEGGGPPWAKVRKGSKNGVTTAKNDKNMGDKGASRISRHGDSKIAAHPGSR